MVFFCLSPEVQAELMYQDIDVNNSYVPQSIRDSFNMTDSFQFRLVFVTDGSYGHKQPMAAYNGYVTADANGVPALSALDMDWYVIGSTSTIFAKENTATDTGTWVPIFRLDGVSVSSTYTGLWDGGIDNPINYTPKGSTYTGLVLTGTRADGTGDTDGGGRTLSSQRDNWLASGSAGEVGSGWIFANTGKNNNQPLYGMSGVFNVISEFVWDGTDDDWDSTHWSGSSPIADQTMVVDSGTVNVLVDLSGMPAQFLFIARDAAGGTVNIGDATDAGHLSVSERVEVGTGGNLSVNHGTLDVGTSLDIVGGSVTVATGGELNTPLLNTQGTTSLAGGTIGTANLTGGTLDLTGPVSFTSIEVSAGAMTVSGGAEPSTETMTITGGSVNTNVGAPGSVVVTDTFSSPGQASISTTGSFGISGDDLADSAVERTITLGGGTTSLGGALAPGISYHPITDDASTGISSSKSYTHAIDFGNNNNTDNGLASIGGVDFVDNFGQTSGTITNLGSTTITNNNGGNANHNASGQIAKLLYDMQFDDASGEVLLTGLTPDGWYDLRFYNRDWDSSAGTRRQNFSYDVGDDGTLEVAPFLIYADDASQTPPEFDNFNDAYAMSYMFQADETGNLKVFINRAVVTDGTYHMYGLTNEELPDPNINLPKTHIAMSEDSTFDLNSIGQATLGNLALKGQLTIDTTATGVNFAKVSGDGTVVSLSGALPEIIVRDGVSPGNSIGTLDFAGPLVFNDTDGNGNGTLGSTSLSYDWELGDLGEHDLVISTTLTIDSLLTLVLIDAGAVEYDLNDEFNLFEFDAGGFVGFDSDIGNMIVLNFDQVSGLESWDTSGVTVELDNSGGRIYLTGLSVSSATVPEPATMCALGLAVAGLGGYLRKRKMFKRTAKLVGVVLVCAILSLGQWAGAAVAHRWSFSETGGSGTALVDTVGGKNATIVEQGPNNGTVGGGQVTLAGGAKGSSD